MPNSWRQNRFLLPLLPLFVVAGLGLIGSVVVHVLVVRDRELMLKSEISITFFAILMAVGMPTAWIVKRLTLDSSRHAYWRLVACWCPWWMRGMVILLLGYEFLDLLLYHFGPVESPTPTGYVSPEFLKFISGVWVTGFVVTIATLYAIVAMEQASVSKRAN